MSSAYERSLQSLVRTLTDAGATDDGAETIARLFNGNIPDVRSLTGGDAIRAEVMAEIASLMLERLGTPHNVATALLREFQNGSLNLEALMRSTWRDPTW